MKVLPRRLDAVHLAPDDDLAGTALRLEQDGVHIHRGGDPRCHGLGKLGAPNLPATGADRGVVRHVLRLERRHAHAAAREQAAQPGDQGALAGR